MLYMKRPKKPKKFNSDTKDVKDDVKKAIKNNQTPIFTDIWKKYKDTFFIAQHSKCCYCERKLNEYGDVEHYRPKGKIDKLSDDINDWGKESISNKLHGRKFKEKYKKGYWWLAYEWDNYLLSCRICNSPYKKNLFPIEVEKNRKTKPFSKKIEKPLLVNPFDNDNMNEYFTYDKFGVISPFDNSKHGYETIKTCGLYRENLREARSSTAEFIYRKLRLLTEQENEELINEALLDIYKAGEKSKEFSGMVRIIFEQNTFMKWIDLEKIVSNSRK